MFAWADPHVSLRPARPWTRVVWRTALRTVPAALLSVVALAVTPDDTVATPPGRALAVTAVALAAALAVAGCLRTARELGPVAPVRLRAAALVTGALTAAYAAHVTLWPKTTEAGFVYALALPEVAFAAFTVGGRGDFARRLLVGVAALVPGVLVATTTFVLLAVATFAHRWDVGGGIAWLAATAAGHLVVFTASGALCARRVPS